ncbi:LacI family DNA-binding transcriptional regulator [Amycolatopsis sp. NPDC051371]|uniref:LacI family DNA-binding transcriptional regulator n=1 Tax=Amycolatopsis sp. NPDC051371 TaxID=3155800 RepID=UPI0034404916
MKRPTITDIAREAGVSKGAVSYALNGRPGVSEATRHRITRIARELGWSPSSTARALSGGRAGAIGLVLDGPSELVVPALLDGFSQELLVQVATGRGAALEVYRRWRAERKVDGALLTGPDHAAELVRIGLPAVVLGGPGGLPGVPSVRVDDTAGAAEALEYLAALGHRHVVRIPGAAAFAEAAEREEAFATEMRRLGLAGLRAGGVGGRSAGAGVPAAGAADRRDGRRESARSLGMPAAGTGGRGSWGEGAGPPSFPTAGADDRRGPVIGGLFGADPAAGSGIRSGDREGAGPAEVRAPGFADRRNFSGPHPAAGFGVRSTGSEDRGELLGAYPVTSPGNRARLTPQSAVHIEPSADAVRHILTAHPRPTALLCDTDSLAVAALVAARELGLAVPGDLSVVSWDDSELCRLVRPALSAVRRPLPELGGLAVSMLRDLIAGEEVGDVWASRPRLITRGSTGPAR